MAENNNVPQWGRQPGEDPRQPGDGTDRNASANEGAQQQGQGQPNPQYGIAPNQTSPNAALYDPVAAQSEQPVPGQETEPITPVAQANEQPTEALPVPDAQPTQTLPFPNAQTQQPAAPSSTPVPGSAPSAPQYGAYNQPPSQPQYRPAPQFGAYGPVPPQVQQEQNAQNAADGNGNGEPPQGGSPFNPFHNPGQPNGGNGGNPNDPHAPGVSAPRRGVSPVLTAVVAAVVAVAVSLGLGFAALTGGWVSLPTSSSMTSLNSGSGSGSAKAESGQSVDWTSVAKKVSGSVVAIQTQIQSGGQTGTAKGSGAIISKDGDIVTNNHVVSGATQIQVTLSDGSLYTAKLVGTDVTTDLAVIRLQNPPSDLTVADFADSDELTVGESVMAIGNPLGYENTATTGIVSALNRPVTVMDDENNEIVTNAVQLDAAINPGNSGGPTFNGAGQIIGINSSIATSSSSSSSSSSSGSIGIGFAIPANLVKRVTNEIIKNGKVKHVALGVTVKTDTAEADGITRAGSAVQSVVSGGPAAKAGVQKGDVIVGYNGKTVGSNASLLGYVRATALGDTVKLTVVRNGKTVELNVTMDKEESAVNGSNRSESNGYSNNNQNNNGNSDNGNSDNGGSDDPFNFGW